MLTPIYDEKFEYQRDFVAHLVEENGFVERKNKDFSRAYAMDVDLLFTFLSEFFFFQEFGVFRRIVECVERSGGFEIFDSFFIDGEGPLHGLHHGVFSVNEFFVGVNLTEFILLEIGIELRDPLAVFAREFSSLIAE